jgi:hypothetical protein
MLSTFSIIRFISNSLDGIVFAADNEKNIIVK